MNINKIFFTTTFSERYSHIGYSHLNIPDGWKSIVERGIVRIEREMWVRWLPMPLKRLIHYLAYGRSVVYIKSNFWYNVRNFLTRGQIVTDIKDKFASLRIYGYFNDNLDKIVEEIISECDYVCEVCGSKEEVIIWNRGWLKSLCKEHWYDELYNNFFDRLNDKQTLTKDEVDNLFDNYNEDLVIKLGTFYSELNPHKKKNDTYDRCDVFNALVKALVV